MRNSNAERNSSKQGFSFSMGDFAIGGLGLLAATVTTLALRRPIPRARVGKITNIGPKVAQNIFTVKNNHRGMPVKHLDMESQGASYLEKVLTPMRKAHNSFHQFGRLSAEKSLDLAFQTIAVNPNETCLMAEKALAEGGAPFMAYYNTKSEIHEYVLLGEIPLDDEMLEKVKALAIEGVLLTSAKNFPGGFEVREKGTGKMPLGITLAGGDKVDIKDHISIPGGIRMGGFYEFITRYHSLHGILIHSAWINLRTKKLYVVRFGIGEAPKLQGKGMGVLDMVNVLEGPHVWTGADLQMIREVFGEEVFQAILKDAYQASGTESGSGFDKAYETTGRLANWGGKVARPTKTFVIPFLRYLQDLVRSVE